MIFKIFFVVAICVSGIQSSCLDKDLQNIKSPWKGTPKKLKEWHDGTWTVYMASKDYTDHTGLACYEEFYDAQTATGHIDVLYNDGEEDKTRYKYSQTKNEFYERKVIPKNGEQELTDNNYLVYLNIDEGVQAIWRCGESPSSGSTYILVKDFLNRRKLTTDQKQKRDDAVQSAKKAIEETRLPVPVEVDTDC